jgi:anaerobic magnesium-protoporphyrin IX monomethyl ester cyclase
MKPLRILLLDVNRTSLDTTIDTVEYPIGLVYVATALKRAFGERLDIRIESLNAKVQPLAEWTRPLEEFKPHVLGLRALTMGRKPLHQIARLARNDFAVSHIIAGGPHATDSPADILANEAFDCAVLGEGEETAVELVGKILSGESYASVPGLAVRNADGVTFTPARPLIADLDSLPMPDYHLVDFRRINKGNMDFSFRTDAPHANLFTSRGCPYRCLYCHQVFGKRFRAHSAQRIVAEIKTLYEQFGVRYFQIIDDIFNFDRSRALNVFNGVVQNRIPAVFSFPNGMRGDMIDEELVDAMWQAGVRYVAYAIESGSPRIQRMIRKHVHFDRLARAVSLTTAKGIVTRGFFMIGFPTETEEEARMTVQFACDSDLVTALFFTVVYFPGTPLARLAQETTHYSPDDLGLENDYVSLRDGPYAFPRSTLEAIKREAIRKFFFSERRLQLWRDCMPNFYAQRDIDAMMMANIISAEFDGTSLPETAQNEHLRRCLLFVKRFSRKSGFYV